VENNSVITPGNAGSNGGQQTGSRDTASTADVVAKTQEMAGQLAAQARQQVKSQLAQQKDRAAETVGGVSQALHTMGEQLRGQDQGMIAECAESMAETADRVFGYLADKDIDQLAGDVELFARRQPALFLTGAFALGFLASRFFKSSRPSNGNGLYAGAGGDTPSNVRALPARNETTRIPASYTTPSAAITVPGAGADRWQANTPRV
jgi:hypothetical protein